MPVPSAVQPIVYSGRPLKHTIVLKWHDHRENNEFDELFIEHQNTPAFTF
jgi:hypothetical protein